MASSPCAAWAPLLWLLAFSSMLVAAAPRKSSAADPVVPLSGSAKTRRVPVSEGGYLYPLLPFGPGNQMMGLREALVLGRLFNRTVVIHQILPLHFNNEALEGGLGGTRPLDFDMLYDLDHLSKQQSIVTQEELLDAGWNGRLDFVGHVAGMRFVEAGNLDRFRALNVTWDEAQRFKDFNSFDCSSSSLCNIADHLRPFKYAGFMLYQTAVRDTGAACFRLKETGQVCHDMYLQVLQSLVRSRYMLDIVARFREQSLGGADAPYLAVHIRPYEDICFDMWQQEPYDDTKANEVCKNGRLYRVFVNQTLAQMAKLERKLSSGRPNLFVMAHPVIRPAITKLYKQVDLHPVYYNMEDLEEVVGFRSLSLLGMVEEEIATQADFFIGSHVSSMSATVLQDRFARGQSSQSTTTFMNTLSTPIKLKKRKKSSKGTQKALRKESRKQHRKARR